MRDGLYKVDFQTPIGKGAGVVVIEAGKMRGGDSSMYYWGEYELNGDKVTAKVSTNRHTSVPGIQPVFGKDRVTITLTGTTSGDSVNLIGRAAEAPGVSFQAKLTRIGD